MIQMTPAAQSQPEVAYQWMKSYIAALPREEETFLNEGVLARTTGTSRTPVREALLRLEAEGFVKRIPHKGAYVPPISDPDVRAILQARAVVEKWAVSTVETMLEAQIDAFQNVIDQQREAKDDPARFIELDTEFHTFMVRAGGNPVLADFYASLRQKQLRIGVKAVTQGTDRAGDVLREHQLIVDALRSRSLEAAHQAIDAHLNSTRLAVIGY
ncbi:GntR family transcriptional regulator [Arthrobacter sp. TS-15]|uniref:GntR family transcriptional regulator n=1 Tax=Arthrobacter sp. TS-15 TaxID=2510797 RepID=UPI00115CCA35|nr:GntR family transcriptional regulator [Arthrobacter sp. TS-15]TQS93922.1 GntR family transcriptional regulator [Arthrobacter sp. TS-15]